jgi:ribosomal protein S18 acetylase RimI-like enzyme
LTNIANQILKKEGYEKMGLIIDSAKEADLSEVNSIMNELHEEHVRNLPKIYKQAYVSIPEEYFTQSNESVKIFVVRENTNIIGFAMLEIRNTPNDATLIKRRYAFLSAIAVKRSFQRKGIGKSLMDVCISWAKNQQLSSFDLNVWKFNKKAIFLYESLGMKPVSQKMQLKL